MNKIHVQMSPCEFMSMLTWRKGLASRYIAPSPSKAQAAKILETITGRKTPLPKRNTMYRLASCGEFEYFMTNHKGILNLERERTRT